MLQQIGVQPISTERLLLRRYLPTDVGDIYANWATDPEVSRFYTWSPHSDISETAAIVAQWIGEYSNPLYFHWSIECSASGQAIGAIYLSDIDTERACATLNYLLSRRCWGQGLATEAARAVVRYGFTRIGLEHIESHRHENNPASGRVILKCGLHFDTIRHVVNRDCDRISGDYLFYSLSKRDWYAANQDLRASSASMQCQRWQQRHQEE